MSENPIDHGYDPTALRERLTCVRKDPCDYDHTCSNHKILAELERHQAEAAKAIRHFIDKHHCRECETEHATAIQRAREQEKEDVS